MLSPEPPLPQLPAAVSPPPPKKPGGGGMPAAKQGAHGQTTRGRGCWQGRNGTLVGARAKQRTDRYGAHGEAGRGGAKRGVVASWLVRRSRVLRALTWRHEPGRRPVPVARWGWHAVGGTWEAGRRRHACTQGGGAAGGFTPGHMATTECQNRRPAHRRMATGGALRELTRPPTAPPPSPSAEACHKPPPGGKPGGMPAAAAGGMGAPAGKPARLLATGGGGRSWPACSARRRGGARC